MPEDSLNAKAPQTQKHIVMISQVVWNFYFARAQQLAASLVKHAGHAVTYIEPMQYPGATSTRLQALSQNTTHGVQVVSRNTTARSRVRILLAQSFDNLRRVRAAKPDLVIVNDHLMGVPTLLWCKLQGVPVVMDWNDRWEEIETSGVLRAYLRYVVRPCIRLCATVITATSHDLTAEWAQTSTKALFLPNGVFELPAPEPTPTEPTSRTRDIVFVGTLRDWYDYDALFAAAALVPEITLHIYGDGPEYERLQEMAKEHANIRIHGSVQADELPAILRSALCGMLPLTHRPLTNGVLPVKLFEYWAASLPVIAAPTAEVQHVGKDALLYADTAEEIAKQLRVLLQYPDTARACGARGYEQVQKHYTYESLTHTLLTAVWR